MIKIIEDFGNLSTKTDTKRLEAVGDYPQRIHEILEALHKNNAYTLIVSHTAAAKWLRNMARRYPEGSFTFETEDARGALTKAWKIQIPDSVSNEDILQAGLLTSQVQPQPGFSFEDTLLAAFYSPMLTSKDFPLTRLPALLTAYQPAKWQENLAVPLLPRTLQHRLEEWLARARSMEQQQLIELFGSNPTQLRLLLARFRVLQDYPGLGEELLGDEFSMIKSLKLPLEELKVDESEITDVVTELTYFLNAQNPKDANDLKTLIGLMSGLLIVEYEQIEKHFRADPDWLSLDLIDLLSEKFGSQPRFARKITALRSMIRPIKPNLPDSTWDVESMFSWAVGSYLPYQAWCDVHDQFDPDLYSVGDKFSEWLMTNWNGIHANSGRMIFNILPSLALELKQVGVVNLILVVDNLGWSFADVMQQLFKEHGLYPSDKKPYLAMLPTETETSKKCLLSGEVGYQKINDKTYKGILEKGWVPYFNNRTFRYVSNIGSLTNVETLEATTYVVNYLAVDVAMHKSADEIGMSHRDHIQHLLRKLVENVDLFIEKHDLQNRIRVYVVSDHGSTRIPSKIRNDIDPIFFKSNGFEAHSHRYLTVNNERFATLPDNLKADCFFLPATDFLNPENILCARRGNRFLQTDENAYVHGGLLPEEVIVPYLRFEPAPLALQNLTVRLKDNEFRYRKQLVELDIGNPNRMAVEQIQVSLINGNVDSDSAKVSELSSGMKTTVSIEARFKQTSIIEEQESLQVKLRYEASGEQYVITQALDIVMKSLADYKHNDIFEV